MSNDRTAKDIIAKLIAAEEDVDNLLVVFTTKDGQEHIAIGMTDHTPTTWFLSALEWTRWHLFDVLSSMKAGYNLAKVLEQQIAEQEREDAEVH